VLADLTKAGAVASGAGAASAEASG
jgi:hypothetical protein